MDERERISWATGNRESLHERVFALKVENLAVSYNGLLAVEKIDLVVEKDEVIAILGPSGCGKTTVLKAILGLVPYTGKVQITYEDLGYIPQTDSLFDWLNCLDNVALPLLLKGFSKKAARQMAMTYLEKIELVEWAYRYVYQLSGGMRQRLSLARALVSGSKLLLADEPFISLDAQNRRRLQIYFSEFLEKEKITTIFVTHSVEEAVFLADRVVLLSNRPAKVVQSFCVELPKPRGVEHLSDPKYQTLVATIYERIFQT
ncbi:MAG: ABC transporter ATP-binding protein [Pseudothermotoga sp.]